MTIATNNTASRALTDRERAFCRQYVLDFCGAQAALRAGYAEAAARQTAHKLLQKPVVQAELQRLMYEAAARASITKDEIVETLTDIVRADIGDVMEFGTEKRKLSDKPPADGEEVPEIEVPFIRIKSSDQLPKRIRQTISKVSLSATGTFTVAMHDKGGAVDKLMRHLGLYEADNKQKADPLTELLAAAQGHALPIASRQGIPAPAQDGDDE